MSQEAFISSYNGLDLIIGEQKEDQWKQFRDLVIREDRADAGLLFVIRLEGSILEGEVIANTESDNPVEPVASFSRRTDFEEEETGTITVSKGMIEWIEELLKEYDEEPRLNQDERGLLNWILEVYRKAKEREEEKRKRLRLKGIDVFNLY